MQPLLQKALVTDQKLLGFSRRGTQFEMGRRCSQSGQGVVEYILLLAISVMLVLGAVYQFNDQFRQWANAYFGDYISCLLETGELPIIGGSGNQNSICAAQYQGFSSFTGKPHAKSGSGGAGGSSSGSSNGKSDEPSVKGGSTSEEGSGSLNSASKSRSSGGGLHLGEEDSEVGRGGAKGGLGPSRGKAVYTGSTEDSLRGALGGGGRQGPSARREFLDGGFRMAGDNKDQGESLRSIGKGPDGGGGRNQARIPIKRKVASSTQVPDDQPLTIGDYLRYILIAALVIALIVVLGSQALRINQELE